MVRLSDAQCGIKWKSSRSVGARRGWSWCRSPWVKGGAGVGSFESTAGETAFQQDVDWQARRWVQCSVLHHCGAAWLPVSLGRQDLPQRRILNGPAWPTFSMPHRWRLVPSAHFYCMKPIVETNYIAFRKSQSFRYERGASTHSFGTDGRILSYA